MAADLIPRLAVVLAALIAPSRAQEALAVIEPATPGQDYGRNAVFVGDEDGDGVSEFAVAEYMSGRVTVHDGAFGDVRHELTGGSLTFGADVAGGDVDGDGLADLAIVNLAVDDHVRLFSGLDGKQLKSFKKITGVVDFVGDVDGDGLEDLVSGDDNFAVGADALGRVVVFSSATGLGYFEATGQASQDDLGDAVLGPGDLDGDGVPDVVYGAPGEGDGPALFDPIGIGAVYAASIATGQPLWHAIGEDVGPFGAGFGSDLAAPGDVDLDGVPDVLVAAGYGFASIRVVSGATGATISAYPAPSTSEGFATSVAGAGDLNADGRPDVAVASPLASGFGRIDFLDGATAELLTSLHSAEVDAWEFGASIDGPADVNADGIADLVVGSPDILHPWESGRSLLVSTRDVPWQHLGHALGGASGAPLLRPDGLPVADTLVSLVLAGGPPSSASWVVLGDGVVDAPLFGGVFVPDLVTLVPLALDADGRGTLSGRWPSVPMTVELTFQAWIPDASGPEGWTASNGLAAARPED